MGYKEEVDVSSGTHTRLRKVFGHVQFSSRGGCEDGYKPLSTLDLLWPGLKAYF